MTNVIEHDFGFRDPNSYDVDNRYDVGTTGLIMTVDWILQLYHDVAIELFHDYEEREMAHLIPLLEVYRAVYRDILIPFRITSGITVRRSRGENKNFSVFGVHYPLDAMKEVAELQSKGLQPDTEFQVEVAYQQYEDLSEEELFKTSTVETLAVPDGIQLSGNTYHAMLNNINTVISNNGGFSKATVADDANESPALIGFMPYSGASFIRIALVITNKRK